MKNEKHTDEVKEKICDAYLQTDATYLDMELDYGVSSETLKKWLDKYRNGERKQRNHTRKVKEVTQVKKEKKQKTVISIAKMPNNFEKIALSEDLYTNGALVKHNSSQERAIINFYQEKLNIGGGLSLDTPFLGGSITTIRNEIIKLYNFITTDEFKNKYGRDYTLVDMYLTTNLSIKDLCYDYLRYMNNEERGTILTFIQNQLKLVDNEKINNHKIDSKNTLYSRFSSPVRKKLNDIVNLHFVTYRKIDGATEDDAMDAYEHLLKLNEMYGVKYDEISLHIILREFMNGNIQSFYDVAEDYKEELDKVSHVVVRCEPILTRREKNNR